MLWLKYYDPIFECFANTLIKFMMVHVTSKIILSFYHLPTRGRAGVKLGDVDTLEMYLQFLMFHAWFYLLYCVLSTLWSTFHMISWTNLLTWATVPTACFLLFLVPGKSENEYSRNWTGQKPNSIFQRGGHGARKRDGEGPEAGHTTWPCGQRWTAPWGVVAA